MNMLRGFITVLLPLLFVTVGFSQNTVQVHLAGYNHSPEVRTPAVGFAEVTLRGDTLYVEGRFSDLRGTYWAAHIHYGEPGKTGNRLFRLSAELNEEQNGGVFRKEDNRFELREAQLEALRNGNLYINISSSRNQRGEIRGQIPVM